MESSQVESNAPQQKREDLRPGTPAFKERAKRHAHLIPYEAIEQLHAPRGAYLVTPPVTVEVTPEVANALARAVEYNAHQAHVAEQTNRFNLSQIERLNKVLEIYKLFVENLSDDHVEDMAWQDIQDAAKHLLGIMY